MTDSPNRHQQPTSLGSYGCEYLLKPEFWLLGAALIVYTVVGQYYIHECLKAEEEALTTLPTHEPPQPAHLPDNTKKEEGSDDPKQEASDKTNEEESDPLQPHEQDPDPTKREIQSLIALRIKGRLTRRCTQWLVPYLTTRWHTALAVVIYLAILAAQLLEGYWMEATLYRFVTVMFRQAVLLAHVGSWFRTVIYVLAMVALALPAAIAALVGWILVALQIRYVLEVCYCD